MQLGSSWWSVCCQSAMCVLPLSHSQTGRCRCTMTAVQSQRECDSKTRKALSEMTFRMLMALWMLMRRERRRVPACARGACAQCQCSFSFSLRPNFDRFCFSVVRLPFCCCCCLVCLCATVAAADQFKSLICRFTRHRVTDVKLAKLTRGKGISPFSVFFSQCVTTFNDRTYRLGVVVVLVLAEHTI